MQENILIGIILLEKTMRRFFGRKENDNIVIENDEFFHLNKVLRMKEGEKLYAYVNDENEYLCEISKMNKNDCVCKIESYSKCVGLPTKDITLFQMMPKKEYFDEILPKSIELGVSEIYFFESEYTMNKNFKRERVDSQVMTACKQCERSKLVPVHDIIKFNKMTELLKNYDIVIFANEDEEKLFDTSVLDGKQKIAVVIGNEAGFSDKEKEILKARAHSISLGKRILRCDTAVVATLAIINIISGN